jgi:NAD-dependent DNA ligase
LARVERIFADGRCDDEERQELKGVMEAISGYKPEADAAETYSSTLPLDASLPELVFPDRVFSITGRFAYGTRQKVMEAIKERGGRPSDSAPTKESNYLVIGIFASRDWINTNYGRKIERAVELRESGSGIAIISEEHWKRFLE